MLATLPTRDFRGFGCTLRDARGLSGYAPRSRRSTLRGYSKLGGLGQLTQQQQSELLTAITTNAPMPADLQSALAVFNQAGGPGNIAGGNSLFLNLPWSNTSILSGQPLTAAASGAIQNLGPDTTMANSGECYSATGGQAPNTSQIVKTATGLGVQVASIAASVAAVPIVGTIAAIGAGLVGLFAALFKSKQQLAQAEQSVFCPAAAAAIDGWYAIQNAVNNGTITMLQGLAGMKQLLADYSASPASTGTARMSATECTSYCILAISIYAGTLAQALAWVNEPPAGAAATTTATGTTAAAAATPATATAITSVATAAETSVAGLPLWAWAAIAFGGLMLLKEV